MNGSAARVGGGGGGAESMHARLLRSTASERDAGSSALSLIDRIVHAIITPLTRTHTDHVTEKANSAYLYSPCDLSLFWERLIFHMRILKGALHGGHFHPISDKYNVSGRFSRDIGTPKFALRLD